MTARPKLAEAGHGPLIPNPTTRLDERVNQAHESAVRLSHRMYVWKHPEQDGTVITVTRPRADWTEGWVIVVDPSGFALVMAADAEGEPGK